jgi:hypothetical protein
MGIQGVPWESWKYHGSLGSTMGIQGVQLESWEYKIRLFPLVSYFPYSLVLSTYFPYSLVLSSYFPYLLVLPSYSPRTPFVLPLLPNIFSYFLLTPPYPPIFSRTSFVLLRTPFVLQKSFEVWESRIFPLEGNLTQNVE